MSTLKQPIYLRIFLVSVHTGVIGIVFLLALVMSAEWNKPVEENLTGQGFCGVVSPPEQLYRGDSPLIDSTADARLGKKLWNANICGSCHNKNMISEATGPALGGVTERWSDYSKEELTAWVRNSQQLIEEKHPRAVVLWAAHSPTVMSSYPDLTDQEIGHLLAYIETIYTGSW